MKIKIYSLITLLNSFSKGIIIPILSLMLIEKGASIYNISIILGLYALIVIVLELPTGIMADILGRKYIFCLSIAVSIISFFIFLIGKGFIFMCLGISFYGFSRALSSGSFDALFIETYIDEHGKDKLHNITTRLSILETSGLSAGALTGGLFPKISMAVSFVPGVYDLNVIIKIVISIIVLLLSIVFIEDIKLSQETNRISLKQHIKNSSSFILNNKTVICIFISVFSTGYFLSSIETYWQPHFITLLTDNNNMGLLGIVSFLYFAAAMGGSLILNKIFDKFKLNNKKLYFYLRLLLALSLILTSYQTWIVSFIGLYSIVYLIFGMANIPEGVILNNEIPNEIRASVLSVYSLLLQIGGLSGSIVNSVIINYFTIPQIWLISSIIILVSLSLILKNFLSNSKITYNESL